MTATGDGVTSMATVMEAVVAIVAIVAAAAVGEETLATIEEAVIAVVETLDMITHLEACPIHTIDPHPDGDAKTAQLVGKPADDPSHHLDLPERKPALLPLWPLT